VIICNLTQSHGSQLAIVDPLRESMARRAIHAGEATPPVVAGRLDERVVVVGAATAVLGDAANFPLRDLENR
jgi:hypothetical protein